MRAAIHTRTAVRTGADDAIRRQEEACRQFAARRGWAVTAVFTDNGASGSAWSRPGLQDAMQLVRNCECDMLVAHTASILTRNPSDLASILADADAAKVAVVLAYSSFDTSTELGKTHADSVIRFAARWDRGREEEAHGASAG